MSALEQSHFSNFCTCIENLERFVSFFSERLEEKILSRDRMDRYMEVFDDLVQKILVYRNVTARLEILSRAEGQVWLFRLMETHQRLSRAMEHQREEVGRYLAGFTRNPLLKRPSSWIEGNRRSFICDVTV